LFKGNNHMDLVSFIIACILFSLAPGAGAIASMGAMLTNGYKVAFSGIIGLQSALILHILIVYLGVGAFISQSPEAFNILKYIGVIYLAYLGLNKIISSLMNKNHINIRQKEESTNAAIYRGFLVNITNPKSIIFLAAFLPQFIKPTSDILTQYITLGLIIIFIDASIMSGYVLASSLIKKILNNNFILGIIDICFGICFFAIAFAIYFYKLN